MAITTYFLGTATAVAQVADCTFGVYDVATTRTITIGGVGIGQIDQGGTLTTALTALAVTLNASTHPYFSGITWSSTATKITGTADTAGCPFIFIASVSGGTGTVSVTYAVTTASAGPSDWGTATNWSGGVIPANGDTVIIKDNAVHIAYGLDQNGVSLAALRIEKSYTGKIGLNRAVFAQSADGNTTTTAANIEYRALYLKIISTTIDLGQNNSPGAPNGSARIMINSHTTASTITIHSTAQTPSETGRPAVRLLCASASTVLYVRSAPGGVGVAIDAPGETSTIGTVSISDTSTASRVFLGIGTTLTTWLQNGGNNILQAAGTVTTVTVNGGSLQIEGDFTITTLNMYGGTVTDNHIKTGGNAITTGNLYGGTTDAQGSNLARTWATINLYSYNGQGPTLKADGSILTITTLNDFAGRYTLSAA